MLRSWKSANQRPRRQRDAGVLKPALSDPQFLSVTAFPGKTIMPNLMNNCFTSLRKRTVAAIPVATMCLLFLQPATATPPAMVEFFATGKTRQGLKLLEVAGEMIVLGQDGWMHSFNPSDSAFQVREIEAEYQPLDVQQMRSELAGEFGNRFEVRSTNNFLIVQPKGRGPQWSDLFEQSHRAFTSYMQRRGVQIRTGSFPMVAVVMPDEQSMYREFDRVGIQMSRVAGVYSGQSNRVITHDGGRKDFVRATVRHEAAHQSAFNSGVHSRLTDTPKWISEGIGQMFEPAGMTNAATGAALAERINPDSLKAIERSFRGRSDSRFNEVVLDLISGDTLFDNPQTINDAYAVSWALMFYLGERETKNFARLLNETSARPPFQSYTRQARIKDLERILGYDAHELSKRVSWYVHSL